MIRALADLLAGHAAGRVLSSDAPWAEAMRHEVESIDDDFGALHWAAGCVLATYSGRINPMRMAPISALFGILLVVAIIFGGTLIFGGQLLTFVEALPASVLLVVLSAFAASFIRTTAGGPGVFGAMKRSLQGRRYRPGDYRGLARHLIGKLGSPTASPPSPSSTLQRDEAAQLIRDASALIESGEFNSDRLDGILRDRIAAILADQKRSVQVLRGFSTALLWFGVLALIWGVQRTLEPARLMNPEPMTLELAGALLAHAVVGPLVGVLLAAGIMQPLANRLEATIADDAHFFEIIRVAFICRVGGGDAALAVRTALGILPADLAVTDAELGVAPNLRPA